MWFDAPARDTDSAKMVRERAEALQRRVMHFQKGQMDSKGDIPTPMGKPKVDWRDLPVDDITKQFGTLKEGILRGVFRQKAAAAWFGRRAEKAQITAILPSKLDADTWLDRIDSMPDGWPKSTTIGRFQQMDDFRPRTFHLYRKFTRARRLWLSLRPDWELLRTHMTTDQPGNFSYDQLLDRFFNNPGRNDLTNDTPYQGVYWNQVYHNWQLQGRHMAQCLQEGTLVSMEAPV